MDDAFVGSEALSQGKLTRYQLVSGFRAIYPNIYLARHTTPSLRIRSEAAGYGRGDAACSLGWPQRRCTALIGSTTTSRSN